MNGYDLFCTFNAIKLHFQSEKYNFFTYNGKTRVSVDSFQNRKDKYYFHRLARKYGDDEIVSFLVSNFVQDENVWSGKLLEPEADQVYLDWKRVTDSMSEVYKNDLQKVATSPEEFDQLFKVEDGQLPKLLSHLLQRDVCIETLVILNNIFDFIRIWDKKVTDDIIYPKISRKIKKYGSFLSVDVNKYKILTKKALTFG
jgi:hypothetical protein